MVRCTPGCDNIRETSVDMNCECLGLAVHLRCQLIVRGTPGCDNIRETSVDMN